MAIFVAYNRIIPFSMIPAKIKLLLIALCLTAFAVLSDNKSDSIRLVLPHLQGEQKLSALSSLRSLAHAGDDMEEELRCIDDYLEEARRQKDVESIGDALLSRLYCFENYNKTDSVRKYLDDAIEELRGYKAWDWMYNCWDAGVQHDLYNNRIEHALRESIKMYDDARVNNSNYGTGISLYNLGTIYQAIGRTDDAVDALRESVGILKGEDNVTVLLSAYNYLCSSLEGIGDYDEILRVCKEWKAVIDEYERKAESKGYTVSLGGKRLYNELAACVAEIGLGNLKAAQAHLSLAQEYAKGRSSSAQYKLMLTECKFYTAVGDFEKAIESGKKNADMLRELGDSVSLATMQTQLAETYFKARRFEDAATVYRELLPDIDSMREEELSSRLDEMRTLYEVDTLKMESEAIRIKLIAVVLVVAMLLILLTITIVYIVKIRRKNKVFYDIIHKQEIRDDVMRCVKEEKGDDPAGEEDNRLFNVVRSLMEKEEIYKDPTLNRESLALAAGSNTVYLADAIKRNTGQTVSEYIAGYRLAHAARMLSEMPKVGIGEVETASGFNSRSTFSRLFRLHYGMSPSEYRSVSRGKDSSTE